MPTLDGVQAVSLSVQDLGVSHLFIRSSAIATRRVLARSARVLALLAGALLLMAQAAQAQTVATSPTSGVAGTGLNVSGGGWTTGDTINVAIDGQTVCQLTADVSGNITGTQAANGCQVPAGPPAGTHSLTATDITNSAASATDPDYFTIPLAASFTTQSPVAPDASPAPTFTDTSTVDTGSITNWSWSFGDGTYSNAESPQHAYAQAGNYTVTLVVSDSSGDVAQTTQQVQVEGPPTAKIVVSPGAASPAGNPIQFDGSGSTDPNGTITSYQWDFGDGSGSTLPSPVHVYTIPGTYTVTLTVTDAAGTQNTVNQQITVTPLPPVAAFIPTSATVLAGSNVNFDGGQSRDPNGSITGYQWSFGDGGSSTKPSPSHTYGTPGTYTVKLTVTDNFGNQSTVAHQITVIAPPPVQVLILTPVASPTVVKWTHATSTYSGVVNLGERLFCPGSGPGCTAYIVVTSRSLLHRAHAARVNPKTVAASATISIAPKGSAEATFKLSKRALALLRKRHRLPVRVKITLVRGKQTSTSIFSLNFVLG